MIKTARFLTLILLAAACSVGFAADKPFDESTPLASYNALQDEWKEKAVAAWREQHATAVKELADVFRKKYPADLKGKDLVKQRGDETQKCAEAVNRLRTNNPPYYPMLRNRPLSKGDWGTIDSFKVTQRLSEKRAICENVLTGTVVIDGADFTNNPEGQQVNFTEPFRVVGTESVTTTAGTSRTYPVLEPLPKRPPESNEGNPKSVAVKTPPVAKQQVQSTPESADPLRSPGPDYIWVKPYTRSDGTHVDGYWRKASPKAAPNIVTKPAPRPVTASPPTTRVETSSNAGKVWVDGYTRKDRTKVKGHWRSK